MSVTLSIDSKVMAKKSALITELDGEICMMNIENGNYYGLGKVGSRIWELIQKTISVTEIIDTLLSQYDVEREICEEQTLSFLQNLADEGLIAAE